MSGMILDELRFFFEDARGTRTLLADAGDFSANQSRALLHYIDENYIVWEMRDNLKKITDYIERGAESGASIRAAMAVLAIREFWSKYRLRRVLWMGTSNRAMIGVSKMLPVFHDDNQIYAVASDLPDDIEKNIVPIRTVCSSLPLPEDYFDVVIVDTVAVTQDRMAQLLLSLRIGGLFIQVLPAGKVIPCTIPNADSFSDDEGNTLLRARMSRDLTAVFREGTMTGRLNRQKRLVSYILDELGDSLGSILASDDDLRLEAAITQAALAEENILPIYEELVSEDIKYLANRFKESLIEFRLHRSEKTRTRVFEEYLALRREMRDCDDF